MAKGRFSLGVFALLLALAAVSGLAFRFKGERDGYAARLREVYDGAVLSALRQMEDMQLSLSKALLSQEDGAENQYLNQVSAGAAQVQRSLSLLPLSHTATQRAMKFANQAADYSSTLLRSGKITAEDAARLGSLLSACEEYASALSQSRESLALEAQTGKAAFYPEGSESEASSYDSAVSYPTLIYDGPFSDARQTGQALALGTKVVSQEDAVAIARDFVGDRVKRASAGVSTGGAIPCWGVTLDLGDLTLQAAVTQQGGKILWMAPDTADFPTEKSVEECRENALLFLSAKGFPDMQPTYFQVYQGVAVISFAASQGDTLLYPDLVKVQLRMDTAQVVGIEARGYWQNHTARGVLAPTLTEDAARKQVGARLNVQSGRLCLIPTDSGEKLCYEFKGEFGGHTYLSYINALDGKQEELLKVVENDTGLEAV
ncbi:MAG: germination protein YpeB [Clostridia bacterium]|nr:germination protein YpeB [Clostridia bacterium]